MLRRDDFSSLRTDESFTDTYESPSAQSLRSSDRSTSATGRSSHSGQRWLVDSGGISDYLAPENSGSRKVARAESMLSMSRLRFSDLHVFGRKKEKEQLKECISRMTLPNQKAKGSPKVGNELCFIKGESGCGKSKLAAFLAKEVRKKNGLYVQGKFEMVLQGSFTKQQAGGIRGSFNMPKGEPYSGMKSACMQICGEVIHMKSADSERAEKLTRDIVDTMGTELGLLMDLVPDFQDLFTGGEGTLATESLRKNVTDSSQARLKNAFRRFIQLMCSHFSPFVMVLDDLHRADSESLDLMQYLLSDEENEGFLLVGTYRSNEVSVGLEQFLDGVKELEEKKDSALSYVTDIHLKNFDETEIQQILEVILSVDADEKLANLASICYKRTLGNMFYLICFLRILKEEGLLQFSLGLCKWQWDEEKIRTSTVVTGNVVDLMRRRLLELPKAFQRRLSLAACLGASFDLDAEAVVWERMSSTDASYVGKTDKWLEISEENGILERLGPNEYQWPHDQIQSAALSLFSDTERPTFHTLIGRALLEKLPQAKKEVYIFSIVNMLNSGEAVVGDVARLEMADLNRLAARKACEQVGLDSMKKYAELGIQFLSNDSWRTSYDLTLELYSCSVEAAALLGDRELMTLRSREMFEREECPLLDLMRAHSACLCYFARQNETESIAKATDVCLGLLSKLGYPFPRSTTAQAFSTVKTLLKVKRKIKAVQIENLLQKTDPVDPTVLQVMDILTTHMVLVFQNPVLIGLWILKFAEIALKTSICKYSQAAFAQVGFIFLSMNDFDTAIKCGEIAEQLMKANDDPDLKALTGYQVYGFSLAYKKPYHELSTYLNTGYRDGLAIGDNSSTATCIVLFVYMEFAAGSSLKSVENDCRRYLNQMNELGNPQAATNINSLLQCVLTLQQNDEDVSYILQGEAIPDLDAFLQSIELQTVRNMAYFAQLTICTILGEYEKGVELSFENEGKFQKSSSGLFVVFHETFVRGLCLFAMARTASFERGLRFKRRKYKREAKKVLATVSNWAKNENPNVLHYEKLFEAELAALNGKLEIAELHYHKALSIATRSGFIHDAALINERMADFFWHIRSSPEDALYKIDDACRLYEEWGCRVKVYLLRGQYEQLRRMPSKVFIDNRSTLLSTFKGPKSQV